VDNPIPAAIDQITSARNLAVDVGCGPGVLTCYLAQTYAKVVAIDRDRKMAEATEELLNAMKSQGVPLGEVEVRSEDWRDCEDIGHADLVCAVNSILEPRPSQRRLLMEQLCHALSPTNIDAQLLAVFPAMEAQVHLLRLYDVRLRQGGLSDTEVEQRLAEEFVEAHQFDALAGTFASLDEAAQKFYYQWELSWELADAGLAVTDLRRLAYPWDVCAAVDAGYFPGQVELWDWFVMAQRGKPLSSTPGRLLRS
jgi:SAM-dependent methyltransferase